MNSFIKLDNGIVLNISQIEMFGPVWPYELLEYETTEACGENIGDAVKRLCLDKRLKGSCQNIISSSLAVPLEMNNDMRKYGESEELNYTVILKSGNKFFITEAEYNNILEVMNLSAKSVYSNVDKTYTKYEI